MLDRINRFYSGNYGKRQEIEVLTRLSQSHEWSQYVANWPVVLEALYKLWKLGKVSQMKTPFYEPFKKQEYK
jgi:hypothetical protein